MRVCYYCCYHDHHCFTEQLHCHHLQMIKWVCNDPKHVISVHRSRYLHVSGFLAYFNSIQFANRQFGQRRHVGRFGGGVTGVYGAKKNFRSSPVPTSTSSTSPTATTRHFEAFSEFFLKVGSNYTEQSYFLVYLLQVSSYTCTFSVV